jgi:hypothetical protein
MTQIDSLLTVNLTELTTQTAALKSLLADARNPELLMKTCGAIEAAVTAMTEFGPVSPLPDGLYRAWLELVLLLGEAKKCGFRGEALASLDRAIEAVRVMRRSFGIAPGGA